jgi:hypothetical protein
VIPVEALLVAARTWSVASTFFGLATFVLPVIRKRSLSRQFRLQSGVTRQGFSLSVDESPLVGCPSDNITNAAVKVCVGPAKRAG